MIYQLEYLGLTLQFGKPEPGDREIRQAAIWKVVEAWTMEMIDDRQAHDMMGEILDNERDGVCHYAFKVCQVNS